MNLASLHSDSLGGERGQTSAEYVGISAVAVVIAMTVAWLVLQVGITDAISSIGERIVDFVASA